MVVGLSSLSDVKDNCVWFETRGDGDSMLNEMTRFVKTSEHNRCSFLRLLDHENFSTRSSCSSNMCGRQLRSDRCRMQRDAEEPCGTDGFRQRPEEFGQDIGLDSLVASVQLITSLWSL